MVGDGLGGIADLQQRRRGRLGVLAVGAGQTDRSRRAVAETNAEPIFVASDDLVSRYRRDVGTDGCRAEAAESNGRLRAAHAPEARGRTGDGLQLSIYHIIIQRPREFS
jgi:hypothetical protein